MLTLRKYRVLELAEKVGLKNQAELAKELGVSRVWLSALLNGRETPSTVQLVKLCELFDCRIDDIADYPKELAPA